MTVALNNKTYVGISNLTIQRLSDGLVYNFPTPMDFVLQTNVQERQQLGRNALGRTVRLRSFPIAELPMLQIQYGHISPELISFKTGLRLTSTPVSVDTHIPKLLEVTKNEYTAAELGLPSTGVDPSNTYASYINANGISTLLTREPVANYATFDPTSTFKYCINNSGSIKFTNDVVNAKHVIEIIVGYTGNVIKLSNQLIGDVKINAALVNTENKIDIFEAPYASLVLENSQIQFGGEGIDMVFNLNNVPGTCTSWNLYQTDLTVTC